MSETIGCAFCEQNFEDYNDLRLHASEVHADKLSRPEASRQEPAPPTADSTQPAHQWEGKKIATDYGTGVEWVRVCKVCGYEDPGEGEIAPCQPAPRDECPKCGGTDIHITSGRIDGTRRAYCKKCGEIPPAPRERPSAEEWRNTRGIGGRMMVPQTKVDRSQYGTEPTEYWDSVEVDAMLEQYAIDYASTLEASLRELRVKVATGPTNTLEDISFREAVRSEVIVVTLQENSQLKTWKESAMRQLGEWDKVRVLVPHTKYLGWAIQDAVIDQVSELQVELARCKEQFRKLKGDESER